MSETRQMRVLVAEDDDDQRTIFRDLLTSWGLSVIAAQDGEEALHLAATENPQVLVTDLQMPRMDGFQLMERVQAEIGRLPVIVLTGFGNVDLAVETVHKYGAFWFLEKPVNADSLRASLRTAAAQNPLIRCATGREVQGYLMKAYELSSSAYPVFVLLDIKIPGGDGRNILRELRSHPVLAPVPVIMMTTSSQPGDIENCYRWGASGYMVKPVDLDRFEAMVQKMAGYWLQCVETVPFPHGRQMQACE